MLRGFAFGDRVGRFEDLYRSTKDYFATDVDCVWQLGVIFVVEIAEKTRGVTAT